MSPEAREIRDIVRDYRSSAREIRQLWRVREGGSLASQHANAAFARRCADQALLISRLRKLGRGRLATLLVEEHGLRRAVILDGDDLALCSRTELRRVCVAVRRELIGT